MENKCYPAGIANQRDDWEWQGTVVASGIKEAKKLLVKFKKENQINGRCEVDNFISCKTNRELGVYQSTVIH